jgi:hypothetical protein
MEISVRLTITELELLEALLKSQIQQFNDNEQKEGDLLNVYKRLYADSLRRIRSVLYVLQDEPTGVVKKKHLGVSREVYKYQMLQK